MAINVTQEAESSVDESLEEVGIDVSVVDQSGKWRVYLSGAVEDKEDYGILWREDIIEDYPDIWWINPVDGLDPETYDRFKRDRNYFISQQKRQIEGSDAIFLRWEGGISHCGTPMEAMYAFERRVPIFVWTVDTEVPDWLAVHSVDVKDDRDSLVSRMKVYL